MAQTNPIQFFGFCRAVLYNTSTRELYGPPIRVGQSSSFSSDRELIENTGGCSAYPYSVAAGRSTAEGTLSFNELSPWMFAAMAGGSVTYNTAETTGNVSILEDVVGDTLTDGVAGLTVAAKAGSESSLTFGMYRIVAKTADTVDVYLSTSSAADSMIIAEDLDVSLLAELTGYGVELTPVGATDLTVGDVAVFDVRPINSGSAITVVGGTGDEIPEVGILLYTPNQDGNIMELDIYRTKFAGIPLNLTSNEFMSIETSFKAFYDATRNGVYKNTIVQGA